MTRPHTNDNLAVANDNDPYLRRCEYMARYMARRRAGGKTLRQLLRDSLDIVVAPAGDPRVQAYIGAVRDLLDEQPAADHAQDAS